MSGWGKGAGIGGVTGAIEREEIRETMRKSLLQQRIQVPSKEQDLSNNCGFLLGAIRYKQSSFA